MGTWGAGLYDDDEASDLRNTIALLCKVPASGNQLLSHLKHICGDCDPEADDGALFWLVTADQFERRGVECKEAAAKALAIIASGKDLLSARARGADERFLRKRKVVLEEIAQRLKSPRRSRPRATPRKPPPLVLESGEVYALRTMRGNAWHPYLLESQGAFEPDGWGALVVLATGRAFEWLPWVALASLTVDARRKATFDEALRGRLIFHPDTEGAGRFVPKPGHVRDMNLERLGTAELDARLVQPHLSKWSVERAIQYDWTVAYAAISPTSKSAPKGCPLLGLVKKVAG